MNAIVPDKQEKKVHTAVNDSSELLTRYFRGLLIQLLVFSVLSILLLWMFGVENAVLIGSFGGVFNIIPYIGPLLGMVFGVFITISSGLDADLALMLPMILKVVATFIIVQVIDNNFVGPNFQDWFHLNSVDFNPKLDQIILSAHSTNEVFIIDHSTNTISASGHSGGKYGKGGDILFRWGNPQAYQRGTVSDQRLLHQHHAHWIPNGFPDSGKIVIFNNGLNRPGGNYASVDMIDPTVNSPGVYKLLSGQAYGPVSANEIFKAPVPSDFYAMNLSGAYSLTDGGLFITSGPQGALIETNKNGDIVWKYINPINATGPVTQGETPSANMLFRAQWYPFDYSGFKNKTMTVGKEIEKNPISPSLCAANNIKDLGTSEEIGFYPNPTSGMLYFRGSVANQVQIHNIDGRILVNCNNDNPLDLKNLKPGFYTIEYNHRIYQWVYGIDCFKSLQE